MLKHSLVFILKRPLGVNMYIDGGLKGNSRETTMCRGNSPHSMVNLQGL